MWPLLKDTVLTAMVWLFGGAWGAQYGLFIQVDWDLRHLLAMHDLQHHHSLVSPTVCNLCQASWIVSFYTHIAGPQPTTQSEDLHRLCYACPYHEASSSLFPCPALQCPAISVAWSSNVCPLSLLRLALAWAPPFCAKTRRDSSRKPERLWGLSHVFLYSRIRILCCLLSAWNTKNLIFFCEFQYPSYSKVFCIFCSVS